MRSSRARRRPGGCKRSDEGASANCNELSETTMRHGRAIRLFSPERNERFAAGETPALPGIPHSRRFCCVNHFHSVSGRVKTLPWLRSPDLKLGLIFRRPKDQIAVQGTDPSLLFGVPCEGSWALRPSRKIWSINLAPKIKSGGVADRYRSRWDAYNFHTHETKIPVP